MTFQSNALVFSYENTNDKSSQQEQPETPRRSQDREEPTVPGAPTTTQLINQGSFTLHWTASTDSSELVTYELERQVIQRRSVSEFTLIATLTDNYYRENNLESGVYIYRVRAKDSAGNVSEYSELSKRVTVDHRSPTKPSNLKARRVDDNQIDLSWTNSKENTKISEYQLTRTQLNCAEESFFKRCEISNWVFFHSRSTSTTFSDISVNNNAQYLYWVRAIDAASNEGLWRGPVYVKSHQSRAPFMLNSNDDSLSQRRALPESLPLRQQHKTAIKQGLVPVGYGYNALANLEPEIRETNQNNLKDTTSRDRIPGDDGENRLETTRRPSKTPEIRFPETIEELALEYTLEELPRFRSEEKLNVYTWNQETTTWEVVASNVEHVTEEQIFKVQEADPKKTYQIFAQSLTPLTPTLPEPPTVLPGPEPTPEEPSIPVIPAPGQNRATADLTAVKVYPNPLIFGEQEYQQVHKFTFGALTKQAKIQIFTLSGELLQELSKDDSSSELSWEPKTSDGLPLASGTYFYVITNSQGEKKKGRLVIIR